jgi:alpha-ketoglutarate-dependent taurine dioxygenase
MSSDATAPVTHHVDPRLARGVADGVPHDRAVLATALRDYARRHLVSRPGFFVLSGLGHLDEASARRFLLALAAALGEPMAHNFDGEIIREVRYRGGTLADATVRYSDTREGGNLHTDGMHRPGAIPTYFALHCLRQAEVGGALVLVHVDDLVRELRREPAVLAALSEPVHFDTRDGRPERPPTVRRPILTLHRETARITYLRAYIDSGHRRPGIAALPAFQRHAMDRLDALLDRADLRAQHRLEPGQLIVVNNRTVVHGRTAFEDEPGEGRLLLRVWVAGSRSVLG